MLWGSQVGPDCVPTGTQMSLFWWENRSPRGSIWLQLEGTCNGRLCAGATDGERNRKQRCLFLTSQRHLVTPCFPCPALWQQTVTIVGRLKDSTKHRHTASHFSDTAFNDTAYHTTHRSQEKLPWSFLLLLFRRSLAKWKFQRDSSFSGLWN